jgi:hypothetical protein
MELNQISVFHQLLIPGSTLDSLTGEQRRNSKSSRNAQTPENDHFDIYSLW